VTAAIPVISGRGAMTPKNNVIGLVREPSRPRIFAIRRQRKALEKLELSQ
jgi:hypothetical protein